jgi:hypothetical protein
VQGFTRTYWDLFVAAGFSVGVFYLFAFILPIAFSIAITLSLTAAAWLSAKQEAHRTPSLTTCP